MKNKISVFFPKYTLRKSLDGLFLPRNAIIMSHGATYYLWTKPVFGMTETQKAVMRKVFRDRLGPVISITNGPLVASDQKTVVSSDNANRCLVPFAMTEAEIQFIGEWAPRKIKVYFCDEDYHGQELTPRRRASSGRAQIVGL